MGGRTLWRNKRAYVHYMFKNTISSSTKRQQYGVWRVLRFFYFFGHDVDKNDLGVWQKACSLIFPSTPQEKEPPRHVRENRCILPRILATTNLKMMLM